MYVCLTCLAGRNACHWWVACVQEALRRLLAECAHVDVRRAALAAAAPQHPAAYDASFLLPFAAMVGRRGVRHLNRCIIFCIDWRNHQSAVHRPLTVCVLPFAVW